MELWTNGTTHVVTTREGIARIGKQSSAYRFSREGLSRDQLPEPADYVAIIDTKGTQALFRREEQLFLWKHSKNGAEANDLIGLVPEAIVMVSGGGLLCAIAERDAERELLALYQATFEDEDINVDERLDLPELVKVPWESELLDGAAPYGEDRQDELDVPFDPTAASVRAMGETAFPGRIRFSTGPNGIVYTSTYNGLVAVIDSKTLKVKCALRVPSLVTDFELHAVALPQGVLIALRAADGRGELALFDYAGKPLASVNELSDRPLMAPACAATIWSKTSVRYAQLGENDELFELGLPKLEATPLEECPGALLATATSVDGKHHFMAFGDQDSEKLQDCRFLVWSKSGRSYKQSEIKPPSLSESKFLGKLDLGLLVNVDSQRWGCWPPRKIGRWLWAASSSSNSNCPIPGERSRMASTSRSAARLCRRVLWCQPFWPKARRQAPSSRFVEPPAERRFPS